MTVMTIGRCEFEEGPTSVDTSGDVVTVSGELWCESYAELTMRRMQLNGMVGNPDEDVFPATFVDMPELDGFYFVDGVSVGSSPVMHSSFVVPYSVTLRRIPDSSSPRVEFAWQTVARTNSHGITTSATSPVFRPTDYDGMTGTLLSTTAPRTTDDGVAIGAFSSTIASSLSYRATPSTHLAGVAAVEVQAADSAWYEVTGRDIGTADPTKFRVSNGLVRASIDSSGRIVIENWDGTAWRSNTYTLEFTASLTNYTISQWSAPTILTCSPDVCIVRVLVRPSSTTDYRTISAVSVDIAVRQGSRHAEFSTSSVNPGVWRWVRTASATWTLPSSGFITTDANDANGHRSWIASPQSMVSSTSAPGISTLAFAHRWAIGMVINFSAPGTYNSASEMRDQYIVTHLGRSRVVAR